MALLHESLYQGGNLAEIDFALYVKTLCAHLARSYDAAGARIQQAVQVEAVALNLETAIPCGLLITELVTNALKHAFPDGRTGTITVTLQPAADGRLLLRVADDGVGFPNPAPTASLSSLGMQLVHTLASQLGGTIERAAGSGTTWCVSFGTEMSKAMEGR